MSAKRTALCITVFGAIAGILAVMFYETRESMARDLAGITWEEFKNRSELVFSGCLVKGELITPDPNSPMKETFRQTYRVYDVFKGEEIKEITFDTPADEGVNMRIGGVAIVALRKKASGGWELSVDERSCWQHRNEMTKDYHGYPVYDIDVSAISDLPEELTETADIMVRYGTENRLERVKVHSMYTVQKALKKLLQK